MSLGWEFQSGANTEKSLTGCHPPEKILIAGQIHMGRGILHPFEPLARNQWLLKKPMF